MASSQVHISPFGCVLGNRTPCDRYNPKNFHKNLKVLVNSCISDEMSSEDSDENGGRMDLSDLWVHKPRYLQKNSHPDGERKPTMDKDSYNWDRVRKMVLSVDEDDKRDVSPSRSAAEVPHPGGVSSLVRRWKDFEKPAANNNSSVCISRSNSTSSTPCDDSSSIDNGGEPENARDKDSDASERERLRVTDIIKKLICNLGGEGGNHSNREAQGNAGGEEPSASPRVKPPADHLRCHPKVLNSPRIIRGRQAFAELLAQMELERKKEIQGLVRLNAVSKFQHKGRIQVMLRLKFLRGRVSNYEAPESNRLTQSSIMHRRERFNGRAPLGMDDSKGIPKEIHHHHYHHDNTSEAEKVFKSTSLEVDQTSLQPEEAGGIQLSYDKGFTTSVQHSETSIAGGIPLETCPDNSQETGSARHEEVTGPSEVSHNESIKPPEIVGEEITDHQQMESELGKECAQSQSGLDEMQYGVSEEPVINQDWITDVSRPRSEWEDLRQARYQEMLDPFIDNLDIQQLLQRRSVSSFLSGDLREKIDRLMISRSQGNQRTLHTDVHEVKEKAEADKGDKVEEAGPECQEDEKDDDNHDEEERCCEFDCQIEELNKHADSVDRSWSYNQGHNSSDGSDEMTSAYSPPSQFSHFYSQNNQPYWSSKTHPSIEIQLIYDLKNHMEQLHQEIFQVKRSIKSCMNMQKKLQRSIKHEVSAVLTQPGQKRGRGSGGNKRTRKGNCCICGDSKIDSLLYRCGHMCTCFGCAHQLKSDDQNCPICRAPILDIVRTQTN
ncbi:unnamed protein product [Cuscuta campestris]|uniref:RING-type domain-containing protein n=1 Tax=Cuscuta campestris TaxID=132261 RepID=A0A484L6E8_9ASTE|nr:unnamed protein product [Cuscuta campestris]